MQTIPSQKGFCSVSTDHKLFTQKIKHYLVGISCQHYTTTLHSHVHSQKDSSSTLHSHSSFNSNSVLITLLVPTPKNGQTHTNNLSAIADDHFVGLALKGLKRLLKETRGNFHALWLLKIHFQNLKKETSNKIF